MPDSTPSPEPDPVILLKQLDRACRVGFLVVVGLFTYFAVRMAFSIDNFDAIFKDMLNGKELPLLTRITIAIQPLIVLLTFLLPALAIGIAVKVRRSDHAIMGISLCSLGLFLLALLLWSGLAEPFNMIIYELTSGV